MEIFLLQWQIKKTQNHRESIITDMQYIWKAMPGEKGSGKKSPKDQQCLDR